MNNFLLWLAGLFALCLGALFAAPHFIDWNGYRGVFEKEASRVVGRQVRVGGEVNLSILPVPYVSFDKLSIAGEDGLSGAPFIRADNFKMWLAVPPMLQGVLEAYRVELHRPVVELVGTSGGGGNWQSFEIRPGALPFVPGNVSLGELDIVDGEIIYRNEAGQELTRIEDINGEMSAQAISGPYKFNGGFRWQGGTQTLRFSTAQRSSRGGPVRFKAAIRSEQSASTYLIDGAVDMADGRTVIDGEVTAKLAGLLHFGATAASGDDAKPAGQAKAAMFDLRGKLEGSPAAMSLKDVTLALQSDGPPQLMHGSADVTWRDGVALNLNLDSRWIDFDRFVVSDADGQGVAPFDHVRLMLVSLARALPEDALTKISIALDQATLGGEALGRIHLVAERSDGPLTLREFESSVPGGGKVALAGSLSTSKSNPAFDGQIAADGQSLLRFLRWGLREELARDGLNDGAFSIQGDLFLDDSKVRLTKATVNFGNTPLMGGLELELGKSRRLVLNLEGHTIDWRRLWPEPFSARVAGSLIANPAGGNKALDAVQEADKGAGQANDGVEEKPQASGFSGWLAEGDSATVEVRLKAAKLLDGDRTFKDFEGQVVARGGVLDLPVLKFATESGLAVDLSAQSKDRKTGAGQLTGLIAAQSRLAVLDLLHVLDATDLDPYLRQRISQLAPLRVATTADITGTSETRSKISLDGVTRGGRLISIARLDGGLASWRQNPLDFTLVIEHESPEQLYALLSDSRQFSGPAKSGSGRARLLLKASGVAKESMLARAAVESDAVSLDYYGSLSLKEGEPPGLDGYADIAGKDLRTTFALFGLELASGVEDVAVTGRFQIARSDKTLRLEATKAQIGGSGVAGFVTLTQQTNAPSKLVVDLKAERATLPGLLAALTARETAASTEPLQLTAVDEKIADTAKSVADVAAVERSAMWSPAAFDLGPLLNIEGYIKAAFDTFALEPGLAMGATTLEVSVSPGQLSVTSLKGEALGGSATAKFDLVKAPAGVTVDGTVSIAVGKAPEKKPAKAGQNEQAGSRSSAEQEQAAIAFDLSYQGRALSPQALVSDLEGGGKIVLAEAALRGLTAKEVRTVAKETLDQDGIIESKALVTALRQKLKDGEIQLGALEVPVKLEDGTLKVAPIEIESKDGKTRFQADLTLSTMKLDSQWKIEAASLGAPGESETRALLPAVTVVYLGRLANMGELVPRIGTGALERELAVLKMERDVAELERLRKLDEARAKEEEQRRIELERSLREQRARQAERERLIQQQGEGALDVDDVPIEGDGEAGGEEVQQPPQPRRARPRRKPPPQNVWKPFQITPY